MLVVAPHSDDETIGAYGLIRLQRLRGARVRVLVVTDGAASHPGSVRWPKRRLTAERRRETRRAMQRIGVTAAQVTFLGLPDGALTAAAPSALRRIGRAVRRMAGLKLLVAPSGDDAHPDHRAVALEVARAGTAGCRRLSYLVWPTPRHGGALRALALGPAALAKRTAIRRYRTQTGAITDDPSGFTIAPHELRAFSHPLECYREERRCGR